MILNLTQHQPTAEQVASGVVEPEDKKQVQSLLTFTSLPTAQEIEERAEKLAAIAKESGFESAMIGGAPYLMSPLESALKAANIKPVHSFTERRATEKVMEDGSVQKGQVFVHIGFVEV